MAQELREIHAEWLQRKEEEQRSVTEAEAEGGAAGVPAEAGTPTAFVPRDLHIDVGIPSSVFQGITPPSTMLDVDPS